MAIDGISGGQQANTFGYGIEQKKNNELFPPVEIKEDIRAENENKAENRIEDRVIINPKSKEAAGAASQVEIGTRPEQGTREAANIETQKALQAYQNAENMDNNNKPEQMRNRQISMIVG